MTLAGRLHPLLIHFPIALVLVAVAAEGAALFTKDNQWHVLAIGNVRAGAVFAVVAAFAGWFLASAPGMEATPLLEWHRWIGTAAAVATLCAALMAGRGSGASGVRVWIYRMALACAAGAVAVAGHLGGQLVWGADFLRP